MKQSGYAIQYASKELKADRKVAPEAVNQVKGAPHYASLPLRIGGLEAYAADLRVAYNTPMATFLRFAFATPAI